MNEERSQTLPRGPRTGRRGSEVAFGFYRALIWVYGGFLLGLLTYALRVGDEIVFWPWSSVFILLLVGLAVWRHRLYPTRHQDLSPGDRGPESAG